MYEACEEKETFWVDLEEKISDILYICGRIDFVICEEEGITSDLKE